MRVIRPEGVQPPDGAKKGFDIADMPHSWVSKRVHTTLVKLLDPTRL